MGQVGPERRRDVGDGLILLVVWGLLALTSALIWREAVRGLIAIGRLL